MEAIQTTGGIFTEENRKNVINNICSVFSCKEKDIIELVPVQAGLTNIVLSFKYNGGKYVYRHPGLGSEALVDRGRETMMQALVSQYEIDNTLIAMDVENGWRISKFVENEKFEYKNLNHMVRAIMLLRSLHDIPCNVRFELDVISKAEQIKKDIPNDKYGNFDSFKEIKDRIYKLYQLSKKDGIKKCYVHGDARDDNFLINKNEIVLIDWEYGGYNDPGFDIGSYVCGGVHSFEEVDRILFTYFRKEPSLIQKRHFYAWIAITGWFYLHWVMLKESKGQKVGALKDQWYYYAKEYSKIALELYGGNN